jgi:molybdopterin-guanine dinucleotide biosynthesis protein B
MKHDPICSPEDNLMAVVTDKPVDRGVPCLDIDDIRGIADLIEDRFLKGKTV